MMAVFALSSCSEDDNTVDEYANWQERNEKAFADTLAYARQQIANGSDEWKVILNWSLQNQTPNKDANGNTVSLTYKDVIISLFMFWIRARVAVVRCIPIR